MSLIGDLYRASPENRRFLQARLLGANAELASYQKLVSDAVYPDPFSRKPIRVSEAQRLMRQYRAATKDVAGSVELTLTFLEAGTEQAVDLGYGDEGYFRALARALDSVVEGLKQLEPAARERALARLHRLAARAAKIGWGYGDYVRDMVAELGEE